MELRVQLELLKCNKEWNIIPTKIEAFDFISFEQIQREIGY